MLFSFRHSLSYFSVTVTKHHDQGKLLKKAYNLGPQFQRVRILDHHSGEHSSMPGSGAIAENILNHKHKAERINGE